MAKSSERTDDGDVRPTWLLHAAPTAGLVFTRQLRQLLHHLCAQTPDIANTEQAKRLYEYGCVTEMDVVQLIYRPSEPQGALKDFQFGRSTMEERWQQGLSDARTTLHASPWLAPIPKELGVRVFDVIHEILVGHRKEAA